MLKNILKSLLNNKSKYKHYSSSDHKRRHYSHRPSNYGHKYYKKKHRSSGFFRSYSSS